MTPVLAENSHPSVGHACSSAAERLQLLLTRIVVRSTTWAIGADVRTLAASDSLSRQTLPVVSSDSDPLLRRPAWRAETPMQRHEASCISCPCRAATACRESVPQTGDPPQHGRTRNRASTSLAASSAAERAAWREDRYRLSARAGRRAGPAAQACTAV